MKIEKVKYNLIECQHDLKKNNDKNRKRCNFDIGFIVYLAKRVQNFAFLTYSVLSLSDLFVKLLETNPLIVL